MKCILLTGIGGIEKLEFSGTTDPKPQAGHAIVKVLYCGVNHLDMLIRQGKRPGPKAFPHILGAEIVGEITQIESEKGGFVKGNHVAIYPWTFCGECSQCKTGNENLCEQGGTIGRTTAGGYAEYILVPVRNLIKILDVHKQESCALTLAGTTAYHLVKRANIQPNSTVLVTGATGGVGSIVIQQLKQRNCTIVCSTSHPEKTDSLKRSGVHFVVSSKDLDTNIKAIFPQGVDYCVELIGGRVWSMAVKALAKNGTLVFCATTLPESGEVDIGYAFHHQLNILGSYGGTINDLKAIMDMSQRGLVVPLIDRILPLSEAAKAHDLLEQQKIFGKILLQP